MLIFTGITVAAISFVQFFRTSSMDVTGELFAVARSKAYQLILLAYLALNIRHIAFRLRDKDAGDWRRLILDFAMWAGQYRSTLSPNPARSRSQAGVR